MAPSFQLVIENLKKSAHSVPVRLYGQLLDDLQSVIYLLGANVEGIHLSSKGPLPASLVDTYTLEVKAEHAGSFAAEVAFAEPQGLDVFDEPRREVLLQLEHLCRAIANRDNERLYQIIPNALLRRKLLRAFRSLTAQLGRDFSASLQLGESSRRWHFDAEAPQWIDQILTRVSEKSRLEMWGQLIELRVVDEFRFTLLSAGKEIKCSFDEELLENIIPCIGQPVSVTGEGIWSERGLERVVLKGLQRLRPGEVEMSVITCGKERYYLKEPLRAELAFHDLDETWELVCPELHISCVGNDPPALREEFSNDFDVLWHEYACAQDDELTPGGIRLKRKLHALVDFIQSGV